MDDFAPTLVATENRGLGVGPTVPPGARTRRPGAFYDLKAASPAAVAKTRQRSRYEVLPCVLRLGNTVARLTVIHDVADYAVDHLVAVGGRRSDGRAAASLLADQVAVPLDRFALPPLGSEPHLLVHVQRRHLVRR